MKDRRMEERKMTDERIEAANMERWAHLNRDFEVQLVELTLVLVMIYLDRREKNIDISL